MNITSVGLSTQSIIEGNIMILSKPAFELHQNLRDYIENEIAYHGEVSYLDVLTHFFGINACKEDNLSGSRTLLNISDHPTFRRQLYPNVTQIEFRLFYVRLAKRYLGTREINGVCMDDWYSALFREWSDLKKLPHTEDKKLHQVRQVVKVLLHTTYPLLAVHGLIPESDVDNIKAITAKTYRDLIVLNKDNFYPVNVSPDGIIFASKFKYVKETGRRYYQSGSLKTTKMCEIFPHDITHFNSVYPMTNKRYILLENDMNVVGISTVRHCDNYLYDFWYQSLGFWINRGDTSSFEPQ
ncbi:hypothetical protein [Vibrio phage Va2]|nr:hypothetical protein [Vibrio phage Va2]